MERKINFTKMHGLGNCYIYIDLFKETFDSNEYSELAKLVSNEHTGIGSDGLILIGPSEVASMSMRIFNRDGSEAKNCGNGLRCVAKFAYERDIVQHTTFTIETLSGVVGVEVQTQSGIVTDVTIDMGVPILNRKDIPMLGKPDEYVLNESISISEKELEITAVSMGNPHGIFFVDDFKHVPIQTIGPILADHHPTFPDGLNVGFVEMISETEMNYLVWERGSGMTQACGTGACAAVVAAVLTDRAIRGKQVTVHLSGGDLDILWHESGHVFMTGPAEYICEGIFYL